MQTKKKIEEIEKKYTDTFLPNLIGEIIGDLITDDIRSCFFHISELEGKLNQTIQAVEKHKESRNLRPKWHQTRADEELYETVEKIKNEI